MRAPPGGGGHARAGGRRGKGKGSKSDCTSVIKVDGPADPIDVAMANALVTGNDSQKQVDLYFHSNIKKLLSRLH